jgi:hypothetical protein
MHRLLLHTFQRTGRNFTQTAVHQLGRIWIDSSQSLNLDTYKDYDHIITIIRNPIDTIASLATMSIKYHDVQSIADNVNSAAEEWLKFHKQLDTFLNICIDFREIEKDVEPFVQKILSIAGIPQVIDYSNINMDELMKKYEIDQQADGFVITKKNHPQYLNVLEYTKSLDLSEHFEIYDKLIQRCV